MDSILSQIGLVSTFVERFTEFVKRMTGYNVKYPEYKEQIGVAISLVCNLGLCVYWNVDIFTAAGFAFHPIVGELLTGAFASLGSEIVHELVELLKMLRANMAEVAKSARIRNEY